MASGLRKRKTSPKSSPIKLDVLTPPPSTSSEGSPINSSPRNIADILYAEDGQTFYPCKSCCRAFANKPDLEKHFSICSTGGRSTPSPFAKPSTSDKENNVTGGAFEIVVNINNNELVHTPKKRGRKPKKKDDVVKKEGDTNVITTGSVSENINSLSDQTKADVLKNINELLNNTSISIVASENYNTITVKTNANGSQPALEITSRNLDANRVEITTVKVDGLKLPNERLPDIAEILEAHFGGSKPPQRAPTDDEDDIKSIKSSRLLPKSINQESIIGESELGDIQIDDSELDSAIILEDLDIHICKQCGSVYHTLEDLVNHDKYEHRNVKKRYMPSELEKFDVQFKSSETTTCPICAKPLSSKTAWPRHLLTHSIVLNFECGICKKKFTRNDHMKMHERRHVVHKNKKSKH